MYHTYDIVCIYVRTYVHMQLLLLYVRTYIYTYWHGQGLTKDQEMTKSPRVIGEGWNSQKELSGPVVQKKEEKSPVSSSKALTRFRSYRLCNLFLRIGIACMKVVY